MFALIRKDFIASRLFLMIGLAVYVLYSIIAYQRPLGYFFLNFVAIVVMVMIPIVIDDKYRFDTLVCYLPPSRIKVVLSRYTMALVALLTGLGMQYGFGAILSLWFEETGFWTLCAPQAVLTFCIVPVTTVSLYFPFFFRYGLGRGAFVFAIWLIVLSIMITSPLLATDFFSANGGFALTPEMMKHPEMALVAFIDHIASAVGNGFFYTAVSIGNVVLVTASIALSIRFFKKRDF